MKPTLNLLFCIFILFTVSVSANSNDGWTLYNLPQPTGVYDDVVTNFAIDKQINIYLVSSGRIMHFTNNQWEEIKNSQFPNELYLPVKSIQFDSKGNLWGTSQFGLMNYNTSNKELKYFDRKSIKNDWDYGYITGLIIDNKDNIWFTSRTAYLTKFDGSDFIDYDIMYQNKVLECSFSSTEFIEDKESNIWISGIDGLLKVSTNTPVDSLIYTKYSLDDLHFTGSVNAFSIDSLGRIWAASRNGEVSYLNANKWDSLNIPNDFKGIPTEMSSSYINSMSCDKSGKMYLFWDRAGFFLTFGNDGILKKNDFPTLKNTSHILSVGCSQLDVNGTLWIGLHPGGLLSYNPNQTGIKQSESNSTITINPNPAVDFIELNGCGENSHKFGFSDFRVFNALGECVMTDNLKGVLPFRINISGLQSGVYFAVINDLVLPFTKTK